MTQSYSFLIKVATFQTTNFDLSSVYKILILHLSCDVNWKTEKMIQSSDQTLPQITLTLILESFCVCLRDFSTSVLEDKHVITNVIIKIDYLWVYVTHGAKLLALLGS